MLQHTTNCLQHRQNVLFSSGNQFSRPHVIVVRPLRNLVVQAEDGDVQVLETPGLRRPAPYKPKVTPEPEKPSAPEPKVERAAAPERHQNGSGQARRPDNRNGRQSSRQGGKQQGRAASAEGQNGAGNARKPANKEGGQAKGNGALTRSDSQRNGSKNKQQRQGRGGQNGTHERGAQPAVASGEGAAGSKNGALSRSNSSQRRGRRGGGRHRAKGSRDGDEEEEEPVALPQLKSRPVRSVGEAKPTEAAQDPEQEPATTPATPAASSSDTTVFTSEMLSRGPQSSSLGTSNGKERGSGQSAGVGVGRPVVPGRLSQPPLKPVPTKAQARASRAAEEPRTSQPAQTAKAEEAVGLEEAAEEASAVLQEKEEPVVAAVQAQEEASVADLAEEAESAAVLDPPQAAEEEPAAQASPGAAVQDASTEAAVPESAPAATEEAEAPPAEAAQTIPQPSKEQEPSASSTQAQQPEASVQGAASEGLKEKPSLPSLRRPVRRMEPPKTQPTDGAQLRRPQRTAPTVSQDRREIRQAVTPTEQPQEEAVAAAAEQEVATPPAEEAAVEEKEVEKEVNKEGKPTAAAWDQPEGAEAQPLPEIRRPLKRSSSRPQERGGQMYERDFQRSPSSLRRPQQNRSPTVDDDLAWESSEGGSEAQDGLKGPPTRRPAPSSSLPDDEVLASMATIDLDDGDMPTLNAKPVRREAVSKAAKPGPEKTEEMYMRQPSQIRPQMFERGMKDRERSSPGYTRTERSVDPTRQVVDQGTSRPGQTRGKREEWKSRRQQPEKLDIQKQRASRIDRKLQRQEEMQARAPEQEEIFEVGSEGMPINELAEKLAVNQGEILKTLFMKGIMVSVNQVLDKEMVKVVAEEYEVEVLDLEEAGVDSMARKDEQEADEEEDPSLLIARPPVVTVMGHVDHGKTSLLDFIRKTKVAAGEAGGITQAIGAYTCQVAAGEGLKQVTFIDTPGHEAFTAMRARGAKVTDIAIIVVAADDGVRPQTREAISHARAAKVPIVVAINKVDKEGANPEKARQEMSEAGLLPEEWGGDVPMVEISAKKGQGIDDLLETLLLVAEVEQLTANPSRMARGSVVEANMSRNKGPLATMLVAGGTLRVGDVLHAGAAFGKVRNLMDSGGNSIQEAGPSMAVQVVGLDSVPIAGDEFNVLSTEQEARKIASAIEESQRLARLDDQMGGTMVTGVSFATMDTDEESEGLQSLNIILKADASGSVEAVKGALLALPQDRVTLRFLMTGTGPVTSADVQLANASQGIIVNFNMDVPDAVQAQAKRLGVKMNSYKVIYEAIDEIRNIMEGRLGAIEERTPLGEAEVRAVFGSGSKKVAGCMVTEGALEKGCLIVVKRKKRTVHEGELVSLRRVKENVSEISQGNECGVGVADFIDWREGDRLEAFKVTSKKLTLEEASNRQLTSNLKGLDQEEEEWAAA